MTDQSSRRSFGFTLLGVIARSIAVLIGASSVSFILMDQLPGDAAVIIARTPQPDVVAGIRANLGLDRSLLERYSEWASQLFLHGDGGALFSSHVPVWQAASTAAHNSFYLVACALPLLLLIGIATGVAAGTRPASWRDYALSGGAQTTLAIPDFAITTALLVLLAGILRIVPAVSLVPPGGSPLDRPQALVVPALAIALVGGSWLQRMVRGAIVDAAALPHVRAATLSGIHPVTVVMRYTLPAAAGPIAQACAATVPYAITGTVVVENVVGFPGVGSLIATLIAARETVAVASLTAVLAAITVVAFSLADLLGHHSGENTQDTLRRTLQRTRRKARA